MLRRAVADKMRGIAQGRLDNERSHAPAVATALSIVNRLRHTVEPGYASHRILAGLPSPSRGTDCGLGRLPTSLR